MASESTNIFDVAKKVNDHLSSLPKEDQVKVLRWVAESLGVSIGSQTTPPASPTRVTPSPVSPDAPVAASDTPKEVTDIKTFVQEKKPKSDNQFAAVVAYYYRFKAPENERQDTINSDVLQNAARLSRGGHVLHQPNKTLNNAEKQGYLDRVGRGQFTISTVGENLVAMTLPGGTGDDNSVAPNRRQRRRKAEAKKKTGRKKSGTKATRQSRKKQ